MKTKVINFFGGPGSGKSSTAAKLFAYMKEKEYNVELINEFAKDLTWAQRHFEFGNQIFIGINQYHKQWILKDKVEYIITDSPLVLNWCYFKDQLPYIKELYINLLQEFENYNFFIERSKTYNPIGRNQTFEEAKELDKKIFEAMNIFNIEYELIRSYDIKSVIQSIGKEKWRKNISL